MLYQLQVHHTELGNQSAAGPTWLEMRERDLAGEELPQTQGIAEDIGLDGVAGALCEHLRSHPAQVLHRPKVMAQSHPAEPASEPSLEKVFQSSQTAWAGNYSSSALQHMFTRVR